jgi:hypothetical protein
VSDADGEYVRPEIEQRQHRRAVLVTQVRCESLGRDDLLLSRDISAGGVFVSAKDPFPNDCEVGLALRLHSRGPLITCQGRVVYSLKGLGMGIQFHDLSEETREALAKFVEESIEV